MSNRLGWQDHLSVEVRLAETLRLRLGHKHQRQAPAAALAHDVGQDARSLPQVFVEPHVRHCGRVALVLPLLRGGHPAQESEAIHGAAALGSVYIRGRLFGGLFRGQVIRARFTEGRWRRLEAQELPHLHRFKTCGLK